MKILYDHQTFTGSKYGGVARYFYDLIRTLKDEPEAEIQLALQFSNTEYLKDKSIGTYLPYHLFGNSGLTNKVFSQINRLNSRMKIAQNGFDVFHPTYFNDYFLNPLGKKPFVLTFHDAIPEKFPEKYAELDGFNKSQKRALLQKAAKVIAVSENTKQDIIDIFGIEANKIDVVHHATHFSRYKPAPNFDIETPERYFFYLGSRAFYKNFHTFIKGIAPLLKKHPELHLICAGSDPITHQEKHFFAEMGILDKVEYRTLDSDDILYRLYQKAVAFIYPSLYEGFGIPILEAFSCGCPVVLSDRSSFPEVAKDAALYFNPDDQENVFHAVERVLDDANLRLDLVKNGYERLKDFSPEKNARQTLEVYKSVI